jgi:hypothetical protein
MPSPKRSHLALVAALAAFMTALLLLIGWIRTEG